MSSRKCSQWPLRSQTGWREELRRPHLAVALALHVLADALLEEPVEHAAARVPEDHAGRLLLQVEEVQALAEGAVIVFVEHVQSPFRKVKRPYRIGALKRLHGRPGRSRRGREPCVRQLTTRTQVRARRCRVAVVVVVVVANDEAHALNKVQAPARKVKSTSGAGASMSR